MPVFGLVNSSKANGTGYFAIVEEGDSIAKITSAHNQYFNSAYASFKLTPTDKYDLANFSNGNQKNTAMTVIGSKGYQGKGNVTYKFLTSDKTAEECQLENNYDTSYVGMAQLYRDYLIEKGALEKLENASDDVKLFLEVFGSIQVEDKFLTFPITVNMTPETLTEWQALITAYTGRTEGHRMWFDIYFPQLNKSFFIVAQPPAQIPMPEVNQNELATMEMNLIIEEYIGVDAAIVPTA
jgi:hypothetical protein